LATVAAAGVAAAGDRRVAVVAVSGLSSGLIPRWIAPAEDRIAEPEHDRWNRKVLDALAAGDDVGPLRAEVTRAAQADRPLRAAGEVDRVREPVRPGRRAGRRPGAGGVVSAPAGGNAIGIIETRGVVALTAGIEAMMKTADVQTIAVERISSGYLAAAVRGSL